MNIKLVSGWIGGVLLAGVLTVGSTIVIFHHVVSIDLANPTRTQFWISNFFLSLAFGLFLFLACVMVPAWKRNAGVFVFIFSLLFILTGIYNHIIYDGYLHQDHIIRYSSFTLALILSMFISYKRYKNQRWRTP